MPGRAPPRPAWLAYLIGPGRPTPEDGGLRPRFDTMPRPIMPRLATPGRALPHLAEPNHTMPSLALLAYLISPGRPPPGDGGRSPRFEPCLAMPCHAQPSLTMPRLAPPGHAQPRRVASFVIPDQPAPVWGNDAVSKCRRYHALVPVVGPENVASAAQRPKVAHLVAAVLAAFDMVAMAYFQRHREAAVGATPAVALPNKAATFFPYLRRRSTPRHPS